MIRRAGVQIVPVLHGRALIARHIRTLCASGHFDCIAVDLPPPFEVDLPDAVDNLPVISAVVLYTAEQEAFYVPTDPGDAMIEAMRQARHHRIPCRFIGSPDLLPPQPLPPLPDEYALQSIGFDAFMTLCVKALQSPERDSADDREARHCAWNISQLQSRFQSILAIVHARAVAACLHYLDTNMMQKPEAPLPWNTGRLTTLPINPDHLYFALGELPFAAAKFEQERYDPFAPPVEPVDIIKDLFRETRDKMSDDPTNVIELSPARIQCALTFVRNLTIQGGHLMPSLFDLITAARGVGGNRYAVHILENARYYPYLPYEFATDLLAVGIDAIHGPDDRGAVPAVNLLRDTTLSWRTIDLKPDPTRQQRRRYRYAWNPHGMCSHLPEDRRIESFNRYLRQKALRCLSEDQMRTEKFTTAFKDGIDIRETLRNWYRGGIYIRELPPARGTVDTVIIIFDDAHDERYPQRATWYAEHPEESTLAFYATDPFSDMIGPGIARARYGGLSLLFPPRPIPDIFEVTEQMDLPTLALRLTVGALMFSRERTLAYIAARRPSLHMRRFARRFQRHLLWLPLASFSSETLRRFQQFHILNGKEVRSWATRFIGD